MATKIEWTTLDRTARNALSRLIDDLGASYREMEALLHGEITYSRIRDIKLGNKAPVRLSEFLAICQICHADPVATLRQIIDNAELRAAEQPDKNAHTPPALSDADADALADAIAANPEAFDLAASHDPNLEAERTTPRE